jgi:predicted secreted hydrolase
VAIEGKTHHLRAKSDQFAIDLRLTPEKPSILHGDEGLSRKGGKEGQASYYYSLTRMSTQGILTAGGEDFEVSGLSWMDHEFSSNVLSEDQVGWDWMGLQLSDGRELMLYVLRRKDGSVEPFSSGTLVLKDGTPVHLPQESFVIQPQDYWESPRSHGRYPSAWEVEVFPYEISLNILPHMKEQELITERSTQVTYWEGSVGVTGSASGRDITGSGYVELTGYAHGFNAALLW